jgi:hypothetical protein
MPPSRLSAPPVVSERPFRYAIIPLLQYSAFRHSILINFSR